MSVDAAVPPAKPDAERPAGKVAFSSLLAYGLGGACNNILGNAVAKFAMYILNIGLGISPTLIGAALALPRLYDAITDPVMGNISDRSHTRWGRRRPFILGGGLASGLMFFLIWCFPANLSGAAIVTWFIIFSLLYYTAVTVFTVPWYALGYEMTADVKERTRIMATVQIFASISGVGLVWLIPVTQWDQFDSSLEGMRWVALVLGLFMALCGLVVFRFCRSRFQEGAGSEGGVNPQGLRLIASVKAAFKNGPFMILCGVVVAMLLGIMSVSSLTPYIIIYYLHGGDLQNGTVLIAANETVWQVTSFIMIPLVAAVSMRFGKKRTLITCLTAALIGNLLKWQLYTPEHPWMVVIPQVFVALSFASLWTLVNSMVADACDYSELQTGARVEGMLGGIYGWLIKLGIAMAFFMAGLILDLVGFDESRGAEQPAEVIRSMRLLEIGLPASAFVCAILLLSFYPLTEKRMEEVQAEVRSKRKPESP